MKNQSGFTLIELLLVLAIIGIISAIAIPALLSQRGRARDNAAAENCTSRVGDLVGQWDKWQEYNRTASVPLTASVIITSKLKIYLAQTTTKDKNPWAGTGATPAAPYSSVLSPITAKSTASTFETSVRALATSAKIGQVQLAYQIPAAANPGFLGAAVYMQRPSATTTDGHIHSKVSSLE